MKKLFTTIAASLALAIAAVAGTSSVTGTASSSGQSAGSVANTSYAAKYKPKPKPKPKPYPGKVKTKTNYGLYGKRKAGEDVKGSYSVKARGNARPSGTVTFFVYRINPSTHKWESYRTVEQPYTGPNKMSVDLGTFPAGKYSTKATFKPAPGSVYSSSTSHYKYFTVK